jgi:hypothetical protein
MLDQALKQIPPPWLEGEVASSVIGPTMIRSTAMTAIVALTVFFFNFFLSHK